MREFDQPWSFTGTSGALTAVQVTGDVRDMAVYIATSSASTATITIQSGQSSAGPWFSESVSTLSTGAAEVVRLSGPFDWVRPFNNSTGIVTVRAIGVS
jgi:hypothetical protein